MNERSWRSGLLVIFATLTMLAGADAHAAGESSGRIERIDLKRDGSSTKVFIMLSRPLPFDVRVLDGEEARKSGRRLVLDFANTTLADTAVTPITVDDGLVQRIRTGQFTATMARVVLDLASTTTHSVEAFESPPHVTIAIAGK